MDQRPPGPDDSSNPASVKAVAQVFLEDLASCAPQAADVHHLSRVLRLRPGELVIASDGRGSWRTCAFTGTSPWLEPSGEPRNVARAAPRVTVAFTPVKGDRPEWVVQKLVEIGVDRIVVLRAARSVVTWEGARAERAIERLSRVAEHAAAQSRRAWIPQVEGIPRLEELAEQSPIVLAERGGGPVGSFLPVCVGPEGGWTHEELDVASRLAGLGDGVLRSETAAIVAGTLVCALRDRGFAQ